MTLAPAHSSTTVPAEHPPRIALAAVEAGWAVDDDAPLLVAALEAAGADVEPAWWDDPTVTWSSFDLVVIRSTWDYTERPRAFAAWVDEVGSATRLANPPAAVRWNMDKRYLGELAEDGVPVVPTTFLAPGDPADEVSAAFGGSEVVVKPAVSAGSKDTARYPADDARAAHAHARGLLEQGRAVMVQPYLSKVDEEGETGMVFFVGEHSHAFRKGALLSDGAADVEGLFAVEDITARRAARDELALARQVLEATEHRLGTGPLPYARVDVVRDDSDRPVLLELELVEPSFFLATDPGAADRAAATFVSLARHRSV